MPKFQENISLSEYCSYRIGGPARFFFEAKNSEEVRWAVDEAKQLGLPVFILGEGTNLLIGDEGFGGLVLRPNLNFLEAEKETIQAGAGAPMAELLDFAAEKKLSGLEWAGGLPGSLGGAIYGNAGAFGGEIKDGVAEVLSLEISGLKERRRNNAECEFGYRSSIFKKLNGRLLRRSPEAKPTAGGSLLRSFDAGGEIILSAVLKMRRGNAESIKNAAEEKISYRKARQPLEYPNIGSIFKNVPVRKIPEEILDKCSDVVKNDPFPVVPTARLIKLAGLKGRTCGGAAVSEKHANFIVNTGGAKAADVKCLIGMIEREIKDKFGIELEKEVQVL